MVVRGHPSPRNGNGRLSGSRSGSSSVDAPVKVTALVDWTAQMHNAKAVEIEEPRARAGFTLKKVARIIDTVLTSRAPSTRFQVDLRLYHGWHKGFEATENRRAVAALIGETDFSNLSRSPNVRFSAEVRYGDELLASLPQRAHARPPIHLPDTWRQQDRGSPRAEKMVDTALAADLLDRARNDPHEWTLVLSEDDDVVPPVFTAEAWTRPYGGCVLIVRTRRSSRAFLKLDGIVKEVDA